MKQLRQQPKILVTSQNPSLVPSFAHIDIKANVAASPHEESFRCSRDFIALIWNVLGTLAKNVSW